MIREQARHDRVPAGGQAVKRRDPLAEREAKDTVVAEEAAAGRTGGGTERAIVYDDDALDKLLDRSDLEKGLQQGERHGPNGHSRQGPPTSNGQRQCSCACRRTCQHTICPMGDDLMVAFRTPRAASASLLPGKTYLCAKT